MYVQDNNEVFPLNFTGTWYENCVPTLLYRGSYIENFNVYKCPGYSNYDIPVSLGYNEQLGPPVGQNYLIRNTSNGLDGKSFRLSEIRNPTQVIMFGDVEPTNDMAWYNTWWIPPDQTPCDRIWTFGAPWYQLPACGRHNGGMNVVCVDGHAQYVPGAFDYAASLGWNNTVFDWPERNLTFHPKGPGAGFGE
jgi:prepilin-type processing-associated H-X9-DG protein